GHVMPEPPVGAAGPGQMSMERLVSQRSEVKAIQQGSSTHLRGESLSIHHRPQPVNPHRGSLSTPAGRPGNRGKVCSLGRQSWSITNCQRLWKCLPYL